MQWLPEIGWGEWNVVPTRVAGVLALVYRWRGNTVVTVHNFEPEARAVSLRVGGEPLADALDVEQVRPDGRGVHRVRVEPYGYRWFRAGDLNPALSREPMG
jgi:maltose alpha-D-glucosyltransferase/alpha-amylase